MLCCQICIASPCNQTKPAEADVLKRQAIAAKSIFETAAIGNILSGAGQAVMDQKKSHLAIDSFCQGKN